MSRASSFDAAGKPAHRYLLAPEKSTEEKPEAPSVTYLLCKDGEPHDWIRKPMHGDNGEKTGGDMTVPSRNAARSATPVTVARRKARPFSRR